MKNKHLALFIFTLLYSIFSTAQNVDFNYDEMRLKEYLQFKYPQLFDAEEEMSLENALQVDTIDLSNWPITNPIREMRLLDFHNIKVINSGAHDLIIIDFADMDYAQLEVLQIQNTAPEFNLQINSNPSENTLLDLTRFPNLKILDISVTEVALQPGPVANLNFAPDVKLKYLIVDHQSFSSFDNMFDAIDKSTLEGLSYSYCNIDMLTLNGDANRFVEFPNLTALNAESTRQNSTSEPINFQANPRLKDLILKNNKLGAVTINQNDSIINLDLSENELTSIPLGIKNDLNVLRLNNNPFGSLDNITFDAMANIEEIYLQEANNLTGHLDVSGFPKLRILHVFNNQIDSIIASNNSNLVNISAQNNALEVVEVNGATALEDLLVNHNNITQIDLSNNPSIKDFNISNNPSLECINIKNGNSNNLNLFEAKSVGSLCIQVDDAGSFPANGSSNYNYDGNIQTECPCFASCPTSGVLSGADNVCDDITSTTYQAENIGVGGIWTVSSGTFIDNDQSIDINPSSTTASTVIITYKVGCESISKTVTINQAPAVDAGIDQSVCGISTVTLTAENPENAAISWNNGITDGIPFVIESTKTYEVAASKNGCESRDVVKITVNTNPVVSITSTPEISTLCAGEELKLTGSGANTYTWDNGVINGTPFIPSGTTYTVTGTSSEGCQASSSVTVPTLTQLNLSNQSIENVSTNNGNDGKITVEITGGSSPYNYNWSPQPAINGNATAEGLTAQNYTLVVTDSRNCPLSPNPTFVVTEPGQLNFGTISYSDTELCTGENIGLITSTSDANGGLGTYSYSYEYTLTGSWNDKISFPNSDMANHDPDLDVTSGTITIRRYATDGDQEGYSNEITINVNSLPAVNAGSDQTVCENVSDIELSSFVSPTGGTFFGTGVSNTSFAANTVGVGSYIITYTYTDPNGCTDSDDVTYQVVPLPNITFGALQAICSNNTPITLTQGAPSGGSYSGNGVSNDQFDPSVATGIQTIIYSLTDNNGCTNLASQSIEVYPSPVVEANIIGNNSICNGDSITLFGGGASTYSWNNSYTDNTRFKPTTSSTYTVTGTDANGCSNTASTTITVNPLPNTVVIGNPSSNYSIPCNSNIQFAVNETPLAGQVYTWSGPTGSTVTTSNQEKDASFEMGTTNGPVELRITNSSTGCSSVSVSDQEVVLNGCGLTAQFSADKTNICEGESVVFTNESAGTSGSETYTWNFGPAATPSSATGVGPHTVKFSTSGSESISLTVTDGTSVTEDKTGYISIYGLPNSSITPDESSVCLNGTSINLTTTPSGGILVGNGISGSTFTPSSAGIGNQEIRYIFTDPNGCVDTSSTNVLVNDLPVVNGISKTDLTQNQSNDGTATVDVTGTGLTYLWSDGQNTNPATGLAVGTYSVTITDANGCSPSNAPSIIIGEPAALLAGQIEFEGNFEFVNLCSGTSIPNIIEKASPAGGDGTYSFGWESSTDGGNSWIDLSASESALSPELTAYENISFRRKVIDGTNATAYSNTITVTVNVLPSVTISTDFSGNNVCQGESISLTANGAETYTWNNNISNGIQFEINTSTEYEVVGTDANGCTNTSSVNITVDSPTSFSLGNDVSLCIGGQLLTANDYSKEITWITDGQGILNRNSQNSITDSVYYIPSSDEYQTGATITITGSVESGNSCGTISDEMIVTLLPKRIIDAGQDLIETNNGSVQLNGFAANVPGHNWSSSGDGSFQNGSDLDAVYNPTQEDIEAGLVRLTLTVPASDGCPEIVDNVFLTLANCDVVIETIVNENTVEFVAVNNNPKVLASYDWDFDDNNTGRGQAVSYTYSSSGTFNVTLTSNTSDGLCNSTANTTVTIQEAVEQTYRISGIASADSNPLDHGEAVLYYLSPNDLFEVKEQKSFGPTENGAFQFNNLKSGKYYVAIYATPLSVQFTNSLPTFYGGVTDWTEADAITLTDDVDDITIALKTFTPLADTSWKAGEDQVTGVVTFDEDYFKSGGSRDIVDNPLPVQNAVILLYDDAGSLLSFTTTDEFGEFGFNDLAAGVYELRIEYLGTSIAISQTIVVDGDGQTIDEFAFKIGQDDLSDNETGLFSSNKTESEAIVYPNPTSRNVSIVLNYTGSKNYRIMNQTGEIISEHTSPNQSEVLEIDMETLPNGVYFIQVNQETFRVLKYE